MTYELFYSDGGHGGPYQTLAYAIERAQALVIGRPSLDAIYVKERGPKGYGLTVATVKRDGVTREW